MLGRPTRCIRTTRCRPFCSGHVEVRGHEKPSREGQPSLGGGATASSTITRRSEALKRRLPPDERNRTHTVKVSYRRVRAQA